MRSTKKRRFVALIAAGALLALSAAGCAGGTDTGGGSTQEPTEKAVKVGLVQINQQAIFFNQMNEGAQQAAEEEGVDLTIFNANDDPAKQNEAIANFVTQGFDAIIVVAIDVEGVKPAIREAADAGVKIVAVDAVVEDPAVNCQVGVDNEAAGRQIGEFVVKYMDDNTSSRATSASSAPSTPTSRTFVRTASWKWWRRQGPRSRRSWTGRTARRPR